MAIRLYIGNLPYSVNNDKLSELFSQCGNVTSANVIVDKFSGRSKGFGFVEYDNDDSARTAIEKMNGLDIEGRALRVNEAKPMEERPQRSFDNRGSRGSYGGR